MRPRRLAPKGSTSSAFPSPSPGQTGLWDLQKPHPVGCVEFSISLVTGSGFLIQALSLQLPVLTGACVYQRGGEIL